MHFFLHWLWSMESQFSPKASDPWFKLFAFLGLASHAFSLLELLFAQGTVKMWWNETRMWMMKGSSSYLVSVIVIILKSLGISEAGFEITSKVIDDEALKWYRQEVMEFAVPSPMFFLPTTLALLNLYCFFKAATMVMIKGWAAFNQMALQIIISGYISLISMPLYEALCLRKDKGEDAYLYNCILFFACPCFVVCVVTFCVMVMVPSVVVFVANNSF